LLSTGEKLLLLFIIGFFTFLFLQAVHLRWRLVKRGRPDGRLRGVPKRLVRTLWLVLTQKILVRHRFLPGLMHAFIFWGFLVFLISTLNILINAFFGEFSLLGSGVVSRIHLFLLNIFALLVILGVIFLGIRRFLFRPEPLTEPRKENEVLIYGKRAKHAQIESFIVLFLIFILMVTFLLERSALLNMGRGDSADVIASLFTPAFSGLPDSALFILRKISWWGHIVGVFLFLAIIPRSKHLHILTGAIDVFLKRDKPYGVLDPIDLEGSEIWGASKLEELPRKSLFDAFACIECGRCQDNCPAYEAGTSLSPKWLIVNLREVMLKEAKGLLKGEGSDSTLIGSVMTEEALWACTTCGACMEACPMDIEHIPAILEMRRSKVLVEGNFPKELNPLFKGLEGQGNPWGIFQGERMSWSEGLNVVTVKENPEPDVLYWVGCASSFDDRAKRIARAMIKIFENAGISYAVLGEEEMCTGDPARRTGNEYLFDMLAQKNVETLKKYRFCEIVTHCPHCYTTLKDEYSQYGLKLRVRHHTQFILGVLKEGKLNLKRRLEADLVFHDPCYLGRHQGIYSQPRDIIRSLGPKRFVEMKRNRERSFCCGAGGGRMWMETRRGEKVNEIRSREALGTGSEVLVTACPFCMRMLHDGLAQIGGEEKMKVSDIAELVTEMMEG
jgi:Fe-S oxidoreductase